MENNENPDHGFVKSNTSSQKKSKKSGNSIIKNILISFISGILGASMILALFIYVPGIRNTLIGNKNEDDNSSPSISQIFTSTGPTSKAIDLEEYSDTAIAVANKVLPSVVGIEVDFSIQANYPTFSARSQSTDSQATGSGVIISKDGYILTNNHIIDSSSSSSRYYTVSEANKVLVYIYGEDDPVEAEIIGSDSVTDLAIIKIDRDDLIPAEIGDSDSVQVGEFAMAIGNPLDMKNTVTSGIISGLNREIEDDSGTMYTLIQTDAAINSGNSGGALVNAEGKLIGINTLKMTGTGVEGMCFAIPINSTLDISNQLIKYGKVKRPYIGISGADVNELYSKYYDLPIGIYVARIQDDGPAKDTELEVGDVIIKFNDTKVETMSQFNKQKNACSIGDTVTLTVVRDDEEIEIEVKLVEQP